jgi:hypothetical protein
VIVPEGRVSIQCFGKVEDPVTGVFPLCYFWLKRVRLFPPLGRDWRFDDYQVIFFCNKGDVSPPLLTARRKNVSFVLNLLIFFDKPVTDKKNL